MLAVLNSAKFWRTGEESQIWSRTTIRIPHIGVYFLAGDQNYDLNLRHQFGHVVAWVAGFVDSKGDSRGRFGAEYDLAEALERYSARSGTHPAWLDLEDWDVWRGEFLQYIPTPGDVK